MPVKYVFITGGVVSGLGRGITAASLGRLLKVRGYKVTMQKFGPYINTDPGIMNPVQHGEVFVTDNGIEMNLNLGHYERFINESLTRNSNVITSKVYWTILQKERRRDFGGGTVQVIPHITSEIKSRFHHNHTENETEIAIIGVDGVAGDTKSQPFLEVIRQFQHDAGPGSICIIHVTLILYLKASEGLRTKPTQASVEDLQKMGVQPDIPVCRLKLPLDDDIKAEVAQLCNVPKHHVLQNLDVDVLYEVLLVMEGEYPARSACECLDLPCSEPDLTDRKAMMDAQEHPEQEVIVALIGKYIQLHDAYVSVMEALKHGSVTNHAAVHIKRMDSETVIPENVPRIFKDVSGILVPSDFGDRGIDGKIHAIQYAREHRISFFGLCLGMQPLIVEFARNVARYTDAHGVEPNPATTRPVIHLMPKQSGVGSIGDTLRLESYPCVLDKTSKAYGPYGETAAYERHRHRYKANNDYCTMLTKCGMILSGLPPDGRIVEMIGLPDHPWFTATQAHPELKSRPNCLHPLFKGFIEAILGQEGCRQS